MLTQQNSSTGGGQGGREHYSATTTALQRQHGGLQRWAQHRLGIACVGKHVWQPVQQHLNDVSADRLVQAKASG